uniref:DUF559 domain-containing protein n=1 Tax=viral metagenome TaxID=1070528 RepID=A0A6C0HL14_9ZZZZ
MAKEIPFDKSFASHEKAQYWSDKNELKPKNIAKFSNKKYIFDCNCGHEFETVLSHISRGSWCSYCSSPPQKLCNIEDCKTCFEKSFASHEKAQYWSDKNKLKPKQVMKGSHKKYIFDCNCGHEFETVLSHISRGSWCSYCCNPPIKLCYKENCNMCYEKSFASHEKAKYWSDKNELFPTNVFKNANIKYIFNCNNCTHSFYINLANVNCGYWCPYCANKSLCEDKECQYCFQKSFASHAKAIYWSNKNKVQPINIIKGTHKKYWFNCNCKHEFISSIENITIKNTWCNYCANKKLCEKEECKICFKKSFASHEKSKYWSDKNKVNPKDIFKSTGDKYWFKCNKDHEFESQLNNIINGSWCRYCVNKTEQKLYDNLQPIYNNLEQQYKAEWCKSDSTNKCYPFDFILEEHKIIIELDGLQHFEQVSNWDSPEKTHERDKYKMKQANDNGYSIIRILQENVFYDTYQWLEELKTNIEKIITENKVQNIFMCKYNEYKIFEVLE